MSRLLGLARPRVAVIGVGSMGRNHARVYSEMSAVTLEAVADPDEEALRSVASRCHARPYSDYREMLARESLDIVSVAVPPRLHLQVAEEVIERGVNLLVEKPLASSVPEAERIIQLAERRGVLLGVGQVERFNPVVAALRSRLMEGQLGRVFQITVRRVGPFPSRIKDVGVFMDLATHDIDVMFYLTGADVERVCAESAQMLHAEHEDLAVGLLRFANGVIGVLIENWLSPTKIREVVVNGERGMLVADFLTQDLHFFENNYTESSWNSLQVFRGMAEGNMTRYHLHRDEPLRLELEAFVKAVATDSRFPVSGEDGLRVVRVAHQLADAASHHVDAVRSAS
ncbi:MAG: Gfo/Idh/MocA family protein [Chloroflexota bacterium]